MSVKRPELFGPLSDLDSLVAFDRTEGRRFERYFEPQEGLEKLTARSVDVVIAEATRNPYFNASAKASRLMFSVA